MKNMNFAKIFTLVNETKNLKQELTHFKNIAKKQNNSLVANDLLMVGVPRQENEDLFDIYNKICRTVNIKPPNKNNNYKGYVSANNKTKTEPAIIIKF